MDGVLWTYFYPHFNKCFICFIYASGICAAKEEMDSGKFQFCIIKAGKSDIYALSCTKYFYNPVYG